MRLELSYKNLRPREEIKRRAQVLFDKLERFLDPAAEATLLVNVEHGKAILELVLTSHGEVHKVLQEEEELRTALDKCFHTMEVQLRRRKGRRLQRRKEGQGDGDGFLPASDDDSAEVSAP